MPTTGRFSQFANRVYRNENLMSALGILVIIYLGVRLTAGLDKQLDIDLSDEMYYLSSGHTGQYIACRVLYPLWYKFLGFFKPDTVDLFFFNQQVMSWLLPASLFLFLYRWLKEFIPALFFAVLFLYSNTNIGTEYISNHVLQAVSVYKINHFTLVLVFLFSLFLLKMHKRGIRTVPLLTIVFFILSYARNEYGVLFVLFALVYVYQYFRYYRKQKEETYLFYAFWTCAVVIMGTFGLSVLIAEFSHLHYVISYSWNYLDRHHIVVDATSDFISPAAAAFGYPNSLAGFFISNPLEFCANIGFNFYNMFLLNSYRVSDIFFPQTFVAYPDMGIASYVISWLFLATIAVVYFITHRKLIFGLSGHGISSNLPGSATVMTRIWDTGKRLLSFLDRNPVIFFHLLIILITIAGNTVYMYDPRYFIHFVPAILFFCITGIRRLQSKNRVYLVQGTILVFLLIFPPDISQYIRNNDYHPQRHYLTTMNLIKDYKELHQLSNLEILTNDGDYGQVIPGVSTTNYSIISMNSDPAYAHKFDKLDQYEIITIDEYPKKQDYLWLNQISRYISDHKQEFSHQELRLQQYTSHIYLRIKPTAD